MNTLKYTKEVLEAALLSSETKKEFYQKLGVRKSGSCMANIRRRLKEYGLDISALKNQTTKGISPVNRKQPQEYLRIYDTEWQVASIKLRTALLSIGREYRCEHCKLSNEWNGKELKLHVDHINGDRKNCLATNLRFLCPNCHSQTETYGKLKKR